MQTFILKINLLSGSLRLPAPNLSANFRTRKHQLGYTNSRKDAVVSNLGDASVDVGAVD